MPDFGPLAGGLDLWGWWVLGLVLMAVEILAPGVLFLWLGIAALLVGLLVLAVDLTWQLQLLAFAVLAAGSTVTGRWWLRRNPTVSDRPNLNRRAEQHLGRSYLLSEPIVNGRGRVSIEDTSWVVEGPDMPAGSRVKVVAVDGTVFTVEPA